MSIFQDGKTDVVANELGDRVTPCIVAFTDHDQVRNMSVKSYSWNFRFITTVILQV